MDRIPIKQILKWTGYPLFFLFCFLFFAYKTFPYERLADRIVQEAAARGYEIEIIDLTHSGFTGLTFEGLRWIVPSEEEGSPPLDLILDELTVSTSLFSLISGTKSYSFDAELAGGDADGDITIGENDLDVDIEIDEVDLGALPALRQFTKIPLGGTLSGEIVLAMPSEVSESTGNIAVTIEALSLGDGKSKLEIPDWGGLTLDRAEAGNLELTVTIEGGVANIERATARRQRLGARRARQGSAPAPAQALGFERDGPSQNPGCLQGTKRQGGHHARARILGAQSRADGRRRDSIHDRRRGRWAFATEGSG